MKGRVVAISIGGITKQSETTVRNLQTDLDLTCLSFYSTLRITIML
jgi:hypothetical protein